MGNFLSLLSFQPVFDTVSKSNFMTTSNKLPGVSGRVALRVPGSAGCAGRDPSIGVSATDSELVDLMKTSYFSFKNIFPRLN